MDRILRLRPSGLKARSAAVVLVAIAIGLAVFDWNWIRPAIERHLSERAQREVTIGDLRVSLGLSLQPTVRLRNVHIANAAWADTKQPMAVAGEASFTFTLPSLIAGRPVVTRLVLADADIDLQRLADGTRNWRLRKPEDRGPGRFKFLTLEAQRSKIRFVHRGIGLELRTAASASATARHIEGSDHALENRIEFSGTWRGASFQGEADVPRLLPLQETGLAFPVRGHATSGGSRADVEGRVTDLFRLSAVDAALRLRGPSLAALQPFLPIALPASKPYELQARFKKGQDGYQLSALDGRIGDSDLSGDISYQRKEKRPLLQATLESDSADPADLGAITLASRRPATEPAHPSGPKRLFPAQDLPTGHLRRFDAQATLQVNQLRLPGLSVLHGLRMTVQLKDGLLTMKPMKALMAAGQATGSLRLDTRQDPPTAELELTGHHLRLDKLLGDLPAASRVTGPVNLQLKLTGEGHSLATLMAHASGTLAAQMKDGSIADVLDAKLGLNGGKLLQAALGKPKQIPIDCGAASLTIRRGIGTTSTLILETARTQVKGAGRIDLREEAFWLQLDPRPKTVALLALPRSIRVEGSFQQARVRLDEPMALPAGRGCAGGSLAP